eukprot:6155667-Amphidinium_carterae.1
MTNPQWGRRRLDLERGAPGASLLTYAALFDFSPGEAALFAYEAAATAEYIRTWIEMAQLPLKSCLTQEGFHLYVPQQHWNDTRGFQIGSTVTAVLLSGAPHCSTVEHQERGTLPMMLWRKTLRNLQMSCETKSVILLRAVSASVLKISVSQRRFDNIRNRHDYVQTRRPLDEASPLHLAVEASG